MLYQRLVAFCSRTKITKKKLANILRLLKRRARRDRYTLSNALAIKNGIAITGKNVNSSDSDITHDHVRIALL
jgi:hypothetical protein